MTADSYPCKSLRGSGLSRPQDWVTNISVIIEKDNKKYSRYLSYELRYLLECPRLRKLTIKTGWATVMSWEKEWTDVLKKLQLKIGDGLEVIFGNGVQLLDRLCRIYQGWGYVRTASAYRQNTTG